MKYPNSFFSKVIILFALLLGGVFWANAEPVVVDAETIVVDVEPLVVDEIVNIDAKTPEVIVPSKRKSNEAAKTEVLIESVPIQSPIVASDEEKIELGWVERIALLPEVMIFDAKLTPGSEGNIMHAEKVKKFKKDKKNWVRFKIEDNKGKSLYVEKEVISSSRYRITNGGIVTRYNVLVSFCIASKYFELEFALDDRSAFEHKIRIGRDALAGHFLIDPGKTKTIMPHCEELEDLETASKEDVSS